MRKGIFLAGLLLIAAFFLASLHTASADLGQTPASGNPPNTPGNGTVLINPLGTNCNDLSCPIKSVTDFLFMISIPLVGIFILIGGFQMITAAGSPEKFSTGKKTILYAVLGFVVILLANSVATLIQSIFAGS